MWCVYRNTYWMRAMGQAHVVSGWSSIGIITRGCIDVVLVDAAEFLVHSIVVEGLALVRFFLSLKVARAHELLKGLIGDHGVAPPVVHRP